MSEELEDEVTSINSIYGEDTLSIISEQVYSLVLPAQPDIVLRIEFPSNYADAPPTILGTQSVGDTLAKGEGIYLVELVRDVLPGIYTPGAPCIFDLVEESEQRLQQLGLDSSAKNSEQQAAEATGHLGTASSEAANSSDGPQPPNHSIDPPPWTLSDVITEKKSIFLARSAPVSSIDQAKQYLHHLLTTDKRTAKATHNITAWRLRSDDGMQYQDCNDDGETAAGGRVLHLMELMGVWDVMVVVTRWYGGVHLGANRFRVINQAAREALVRGGFGGEGGKKKGKRCGVG